MKGIRFIVLVACVLLPWRGMAWNNDYVDDNIVHFGFSLGVNLMGFSVTDSDSLLIPTDGGTPDVWHARVSNLLPGFNVGFVTDIRLSRHLNLRFCPGLTFSQRTLTYKSASGNPVRAGVDWSDKIAILSIPISVPLYLKWSAEREKNYRPYLIAGGGFEYNVYKEKEMPVSLNGSDYFCEVGVGCDFYFQWFKFCPQISYRIGFANVLDKNYHLINAEAYTDALSRLTSQALYITFNFE